MTTPQTPASLLTPSGSDAGTNSRRDPSTPTENAGFPFRPASEGTAVSMGTGEGPLRSTAAVPELTFIVRGIPAPQGSKRGYVVGSRAVIVDDNKPRLRDWRNDVKHAAIAAMASREGSGDPFAVLPGPVDVDITFLLPRPKGHYRTGRNAHLLRDAAPARPATKPDVDKLLRGCLDALKAASVYLDDAQVVTLTGRKCYATCHTGAVVAIYLAGDMT